ncbi:MAG: cell division ATP-binding protein FtsE [Desulfobacterales bacterium]|nr:MAG: cell division ATP-binding protein FtsE [Desulfobacterales bacterium]
MSTNPNNEPPIIEFFKVSKIYAPNVRAIDKVSLSIATGEMAFLIGKSGAGKTTLLKLLCNMEHPTGGLIEVTGKEINKLTGTSLAKLRQKIGVAYQDFKLLADRTTAENIAVSMEVSYKKPALIRKRVKSLLEQLDLADKHGTITGELSRGEQQRVALARAIANSPTIILVDEPTGNLDAITTEKVMKLLSQCNKAGATILVATHDEAIFRSGRHRIFELSRGQLVGNTPPAAPQVNATGDIS